MAYSQRRVSRFYYKVQTILHKFSVMKPSKKINSLLWHLNNQVTCSLSETRWQLTSKRATKNLFTVDNCTAAMGISRMTAVGEITVGRFGRHVGRTEMGRVSRLSCGMWGFVEDWNLVVNFFLDIPTSIKQRSNREGRERESAAIRTPSEIHPKI